MYGLLLVVCGWLVVYVEFVLCVLSGFRLKGRVSFVLIVACCVRFVVRCVLCCCLLCVVR